MLEKSEKPSSQNSDLREMGAVRWITSTGRFYYQNGGAAERMLGMAVDITDRKLADEARFKHAAIVESSDGAIIAKTLDGVIVSWNAGAQQIYGYTAHEAVGQPITVVVPRELRDEEKRILERLRAGEHIRHYETVRVTKTGKQINVSLTISPIRDSRNEIVGISSISRDITEQKLAQQALADMPRRLIEAEEQERTRIGRELHDDINQRLALLAVELDRLDQSRSTKDLHDKVKESKERVMDIATDVQALSHQLHSSKLEYLGLATAAKSFCREISEMHNVRIDFTQNGVPRNLPEEVALCLFRVLQEALQNAVKYSGTDHFEVDLCGTSSYLRLTVRDSGRGFNVEEAMMSQGLGLVSMRERVSLVNGTIAIKSKPSAGTEITVQVPLAVVDRAGEVTSGAA